MVRYGLQKARYGESILRSLEHMGEWNYMLNSLQGICLE